MKKGKYLPLAYLQGNISQVLFELQSESPTPRWVWGCLLLKPYKHLFPCTQPTLIICTDGESKFPSPLQTTQKNHLEIILALPESSYLHTEKESRISCSFSVCIMPLKLYLFSSLHT